MARLSLRIDLDSAGRLGPGKVRLLEAVRDTGSISGAARTLNMSYRRAWTLLETLNAMFEQPAVVAQSGGKAGGGAEVTALGAMVIHHYRIAERKAERVARTHLQALQAALAERPPPDPLSFPAERERGEAS